MKAIFVFAALFLVAVQDATARQHSSLARSKRGFLDFMKLGISNMIEKECVSSGIKTAEQLCTKMSVEITRRFHQLCEKQNIEPVCEVIGLDITVGEVASEAIHSKAVEDTVWNVPTLAKALHVLGGIHIGSIVSPALLGYDQSLASEGCTSLLENYLCPAINSQLNYEKFEAAVEEGDNLDKVRGHLPPFALGIAKGCDTLFKLSSTIRHDLLREATPDTFCKELEGDYVDLCEEAVQLPCSELGFIGRSICKKAVGTVFCSPKSE